MFENMHVRLDSSVLDILLVLSFPVLFLLVGRRFLPPFPWSDIRQLLTGFRTTTHPFSLYRAYRSYVHYDSLAKQEAAMMERSYVSVGRTHKRLGYEIGYPRKLKQLKEAIAQNTNITSAIARLAAQEFSLDDGTLSETNQADLSRVRESLKHFVRDWSNEGAGEREKIFRPILRVLEQVPSSERAGIRVLVPGSGLGRLAWEISQLGEFLAVRSYT
jgi:carnosine N-methyltransferase